MSEKKVYIDQFEIIAYGLDPQGKPMWNNDEVVPVTDQDDSISSLSAPLIDKETTTVRLPVTED